MKYPLYPIIGVFCPVTECILSGLRKHSVTYRKVFRPMTERDGEKTMPSTLSLDSIDFSDAKDLYLRHNQYQMQL